MKNKLAIILLTMGLSTMVLFTWCSEKNIIENKVIIEKEEKIQIFEKISELPFELKIKWWNIDISKNLLLSQVWWKNTEINFDFESEKWEKYNFDLKYKNLAKNRSYPTNLDITIKNWEWEKLWYLFWANNWIEFLKQMWEFWLIINIEWNPVDIKFIFDENISGNLTIENLWNERFVQDTLVSKFNFQMIRPIIVPKVNKNLRSVTYSLDNNPYSVNYSIKNLEKWVVQFQYNLYSTKNNSEELLERIYFNAKNIKTIREAMFAWKYFDKKDWAFKLVFYPTMGQLEPIKN